MSAIDELKQTLKDYNGEVTTVAETPEGLNVHVKLPTGEEVVVFAPGVRIVVRKLDPQEDGYPAAGLTEKPESPTLPTGEPGSSLTVG